MSFQDLQGQIHGRHSRRQQAQGRKAASGNPSIGQRQRFQRPQGCRPIKSEIDLGQEEIIDDWSSFFCFFVLFFLEIFSFLFFFPLLVYSRIACSVQLYVPPFLFTSLALHCSGRFCSSLLLLLLVWLTDRSFVPFLPYFLL